MSLASDRGLTFQGQTATRKGALHACRAKRDFPLYTLINLGDVEDAAVPSGFSHRWEARVARTPLRAQQAGLTYSDFGLASDRRSPIAIGRPRRST